MSSAGRNKPKTARVDLDFYETPEWFVDHLLAARGPEPLRGDVVDLGTGRGRLLRCLRERGVRAPMIGVELDHLRAVHAKETNPAAAILEGDALTLDLLALGVSPKTVISNPPFSLARDFIARAFELLPDGGELLVLQRWTFPITKVSAPLFAPETGFADCYPCTTRPSFTAGATDSVPYAWFRWIRGSTVPPPFRIYDRPADPRQGDLFPATQETP